MASPFNAGFDAGWKYCNTACNDGLDENPYPPETPDHEQWENGFAAEVEAWEQGDA